MLEFIDAADDMLAVTVSGHVDGENLQAVMDRLDAAMARYDKIHVFAETHRIEGITLHGLPAYLARAMPLFGKLDRFGRVAVVADQAWVRNSARVESALLPGVRYRIFTPDQRDEAFAWVVGEGG